MEAAHFNFNSTLGAAFLGHFATAILYGITSLQAFTYFKQYFRDPPLLRLLVLVLWILDTLHAAMITYAMYFYMVINFADPLIVLRPVWSVWGMIMISNLSNIIVRGIFCHRLWRLSRKSWILPAFVATLSLYIIVDAFYFAVRGLHIDSYLEIHQFSWVLYVGFTFEVIADFVITVAQYLYLRRFRTGIRFTDSVVSVLMLYCVNTGLLTSVCALLCLITYATLPDMYVYFAFYFVLSKLYVNSVLANLNARAIIVETMAPQNVDRGPFGSGQNPLEKTHKQLTSSSSSGAGPSSSNGRAQFSTVIDPVIITMSNLPRQTSALTLEGKEPELHDLA
ncbi:uncharacterized protein C8Q71DRAFT_415261 [Rhodofomes roseus]|uniref:DUF6534 domain-containing protein n=1 Tax=Rhodofomes roseus TaxID=34475 RepID=A0ABQ8KQ22_9APHY|nr:uncharacterized protein C8Q71DRAFT_415261 [Rhodofomes roseus]KAH9840605.1 hypothetical protein C8Q71DRAFT_415261 [Rhodofomes roseus]